jgi:single-strand DNA-binding protein
MYLNKVYLIGNLTRDPELKALPSGTKVVSFGLATNRTFKDKEGQRQEQSEFHNIVVFGRTGELAHQYLKKGSQALIEGRIQTRSWEQNNEKKYRTEIIADTVQFGNRPTGGQGGPADKGSAPSQTSDKAPASASAPSDTIEYPSEEINPDDIPF